MEDSTLYIEIGLGKRSKLSEAIELLKQLGEQILATQEEFESAFSRIDAATTNIANLIRSLTDQLETGLDPEAENAVLARLREQADALESMAQTPEDPVPVEPVPEEPTPEV